MRELNDLIGTTAVIATLISVLFAIAALWIANRRKKHHLVMQNQAAAHATPVAPPMKIESPLQFTPPPAPVQPVATVQEVGENLMYATRPTSSPLFKRLGRVGVEQVTPATTAPVTNDEQKAAWE